MTSAPFGTNVPADGSVPVAMTARSVRTSPHSDGATGAGKRRTGAATISLSVTRSPASQSRVTV